ncbi:hypothetical protein MFIFM68171_02528 [Madurella fahalii]|uniref:Uncharacterized protein n=1 Tax=Madurella fahalii TaxID=1157608 RepID=A0ABQ0G3H2_9PEZI
MSPVPTTATTTAGEYTAMGWRGADPRNLHHSGLNHVDNGAYTTSTYIPASRSPGHARQPSEESEDPPTVIDPRAGTTGASTRQTQARYVWCGSHGTTSSSFSDPFGMDEPQQMSALADAARPVAATIDGRGRRLPAVHRPVIGSAVLDVAFGLTLESQLAG